MENIQSKTQVVIIGAGPTGLSLAVQLLRYKIDFIILEKNDHTTHLSKAIVIQARTLEIFRETGLAKRAIDEGRLTYGANIFYKGKKKAYLNLKGMGDGLSAFPFALSLEQSKTEKLLVDYLLENSIKVNWGAEFMRFEKNEKLAVHYMDAMGQEQIIDTDYLVGCDGPGSLVRHQLGSSFNGDTVPKIFYVADVALSSSVINNDELFAFLIRKGFVLFFPMEGEGHYRLIGILPGKTAKDDFSFQDIEEGIKEDVHVPVIFKELRWFSSYKVHSRKADFFMKDNCFIAGDAAHIHTPAGGQGMNTGIQDAYNLAWKLAYTIKYNAANVLLETYNTERTGNAKNLLNTTDRMFDFLTGSNWFFNFIRLNIFPVIAKFIAKNPGINKRFFPLLSQIGIAYPDSALTIKSKIGKVAAGDRMHFFTLADGTNIFDHLTNPGFKILYFGHDEKNNVEILNSNKMNIARRNFTEIPKALFGNESEFYILLRPDNHISYIGKDLKMCKDLLAQMFN